MQKNSKNGAGIKPPKILNYWNFYDNFFKEEQNGRTIKTEGESSFTITAQDRHGVLLPDFRIRKFTPVECERLQGFPDNWTAGVSDSARYKCLGNAVTVNVVEAIAEKILLNI